MIVWIATFTIVQAAANQFHSALQLSGYLSPYLKIQALEPVFRLVLILTLGWWLSEFGIIFGGIITSMIKILVCLHYQQSKNISTRD